MHIFNQEMRVHSFLVLFFLLSLVRVSAQNKIHWISTDKINQTIKKGDKKFIIYYYINGCKWCHYMDDSTLSNPSIAKYINQFFYPIKIDAMSENKIQVGEQTYGTQQVGKYTFNELALTMLNGRMSFPSIVFLDNQFNKIQTFDTYMDVPDFEIVVTYFGSDHYKKTMFRRYAHSFCREQHFNNYVNGN
ncbi:MAG: DUF255 domain-containing protein [Lewinellaceae bacterium]|nr:DUF255 domain-containing protein [Lewinellaceae bacterium]